MKDVTLPSGTVFVAIGVAEPDGPNVQCAVDQEWWSNADKDHRKAMFMAMIEGVGTVGTQVIPEEFNPDADTSIDPIRTQDLPNFDEELKEINLVWIESKELNRLREIARQHGERI